MKMRCDTWKHGIWMLAGAVLVMGLVACGSDSRSSGGGGDDDSDGSLGDNGSDDPGFGGVIDGPDTDVEAVQSDLNEGGVSIGGEVIMPSPTDTIEVEGTTDWRYGARAAYSIIHDDVCDYQMVATETGWHEARDRGLPVGWGIIVSRCQRLGYGDSSTAIPTTPYWDLIDEMDAAGQEIVNHSITHPNLMGLSQCATCTSVADCQERCPAELKTVDGDLMSSDVSVLNQAAATALDYELRDSAGIVKNATGIDMNFYAFPLDLADDNIFQILKEEGYIGARGGLREVDGTLNDPDVDTSDALADFRILFDAYNEESAGVSHWTQNGLDHMLDTYLNAAVAEGKWALRELHSIRPDCNAQGHGWGPVTQSLYQEHLDNVLCRIEARQVWMARNDDIIKYRRSRAHCGAPQLSGNVLSFSAGSSSDCADYATAVTVSIQGPADTIVEDVSQGEFVNLPNGRVLVTVDPTASVDITFGTGTVAASTVSCPSFISGLDMDECGGDADCPPLGACNCENEIRSTTGYDPNADTGNSGGGAMAGYDAPTTLSNCDLSSPSGYEALTMSAGYCSFPNKTYPANDGAQWGAQMAFYEDGFVGDPKRGVNAASMNGLRVCVQGEIKNAFPKTRYVAQGFYDITDASYTPTEVQNMAWVYLVTDYTATPSDWNAGHCVHDNCSHPFFAMNVSADEENCRDIRWEDFEFPYWWGDANVGFYLPEVCAPAGAVPPETVCREGEDYDAETDEPLARWHACPAMAEKMMYVIVAAVDDIGSEPVETVDLKANVSFF